MYNMQQTIKELAFFCGYCRIARDVEGSKVIRFENQDARVCKYCVEATEYLRSKLPIVSE